MLKPKPTRTNTAKKKKSSKSKKQIGDSNYCKRKIER